VGLLAGFGAVGLAAGITLMARHLDFGLLDLGAIILLALATGLAGGVLRERDAVVAITAGAVLASLSAILVLHGPWVLVGLTALTAGVIVIAGVAAFVGAWLGRESTRVPEPRREVLVVVALGCVGVAAWITVAALV
jgi:hypothetical protein